MEFIKPDINFDFMGKMKVGFIISAVLIVISIASVVMHGGVNLGIDFTGGSLVQVKFTGETRNAKMIKEALAPMAFKSINVQLYGAIEDNEFLIRVARSEKGEVGLGEQMKEAFEKSFGAASAEITRSEMVGPKVGKDLSKKGRNAILAAILCIFFYIAFRFELKFSGGAVLALIHDVTITIGAMSLLNKEFDLTIIAALLTVVGYSINDTVVVYDRIRENLRKSRKKSFAEIINKSINETLSRTFLTSLTTFIVLLCVFLFGGGVIHNFAFAMIVGLLIGTYSSIFIASPAVILWHNKEALPSVK
ncbi:protein translocase subunit SecF [Thermodesulfobacteriota bacterium]